MRSVFAALTVISSGIFALAQAPASPPPQARPAATASPDSGRTRR